MTPLRSRLLSKLIRNHKLTHVKYATRVSFYVTEYHPPSEHLTRSSDEFWVGQTCGHGTTPHKSRNIAPNRLVKWQKQGFTWVYVAIDISYDTLGYLATVVSCDMRHFDCFPYNYTMCNRTQFLTIANSVLIPMSSANINPFCLLMVN